MRVLFVHDEGPGQFRHLAPALAADPANRVVFLARRFDAEPARVDCRRFAPAGPSATGGHPYLAPMERAVRAGHGAFDACLALTREGFVPDVICAHAGFGPALYLKEAFPDTPVLGYFEWLYRGPAGDAEYLADDALPAATACRARTRNASILLELANADAAITPTQFQREQFPAAFRSRLQVLHDGVDTDYFAPAPAAPTGLALPPGAELLTYATRGMEPMRGFPQFMAAASELLRRRPGLHIAIAGADAAFYSPARDDGRSYRDACLGGVPDGLRERLHFLGPLSLDDYRDLLRASQAHVYLTAPFVLSWSMLEAMACGCLLVASNTPPVREVARDNVEALLVDFRDAHQLAARIEDALDASEPMAAALRAAARARVTREYALSRLLPRQMALVESLADAALDQSFVSPARADDVTSFDLPTGRWAGRTPAVAEQMSG